MKSSIWLQALKGIPRISVDEWSGLNPITRWLISVRAAVLVMTFISATLAGLLAWRDGEFIWWRWLLLTIGLILAHATNNILNDITDYHKGVDHENYFRTRYGVQPLESGLLTRKQAYIMAGVTGVLAVAAGLPLVLTSGTLSWILLASGAFFVLFYTFPLKYIGLGEIAVIIVWGPLMVGGGYYVITGMWSWESVVVSLPYALGTTMVIFGKHIDKREEDKSRGIHTLPVILGDTASRFLALVLMAMQYVIVLGLVISRIFSPILLFAFMAIDTIPAVWKVYKNSKPDHMPEGYREDVWPLYYVALAFLHNREFGMWFMGGIFVETLLRSFNLFG